MGSLRRALPAVVASAALSTPALPAMAGKLTGPGAVIDVQSVSSIQVRAQQPGAYTQLDSPAGGPTVEVEAGARCAEGWEDEGTGLSLSQGGSEIYSGAHDVGVTTATYALPLSWADLPFDPVQACNQEAASRATGSQTVEDVIAQGFQLTLSGYAAKVSRSCWRQEKKGGFVENQWETHADDEPFAFTVACMARPATKSGGVLPPTVSSGLRDLDVFINPASSASYVGACPKTLHFGGSMTYEKHTPGDTSIVYRYVNDRGLTSPNYTVTFDEQGEQSRNLHTWHMQADVPKTGGLAVGQSMTAGAPSGPKATVVPGWVTLHVVSGASWSGSEPKASFQITCKPDIVDAPLGAQDMQQQGAPPPSGATETLKPRRSPIDPDGVEEESEEAEPRRVPVSPPPGMKRR